MQDTLMRRRAVEQRTGLGTTTLYKMMNQGLFPRPLQIGARAVRWPESEIEEWISKRDRVRNDSGRAAAA